jgi:hypothetical protein
MIIINRLYFATNLDDIKEYDTLKSNKIVVVYKKHIQYHILILLSFFDSHMIDFIVRIVLLPLLPLRSRLLSCSMIRLAGDNEDSTVSCSQPDLAKKTVYNV